MYIYTKYMCTSIHSKMCLCGYIYILMNNISNHNMGTTSCAYGYYLDYTCL